MFFSFLKAGGVTQPSQIRYVHYFERLFYGERIPTKGVYLNRVAVSGIPKFAPDGQLKPTFKIYHVKKTVERQDDIQVILKMKITYAYTSWISSSLCQLIQSSN